MHAQRQNIVWKYEIQYDIKTKEYIQIKGYHKLIRQIKW